MKRATRIAIARGDDVNRGTIAINGDRFTIDVWTMSDAILQALAPAPGDAGWDKYRFTVTYEDGVTYSGMLYLGAIYRERSEILKSAMQGFIHSYQDRLASGIPLTQEEIRSPEWTIFSGEYEIGARKQQDTDGG